MNKLTICIPTYKRPQMLKKLILSIMRNNIDQSLIKDAYIIIVDNDIERTAENITNELKNICSDPFKLSYHNYPNKGLSNVRNEIFKRALESAPNYIICIDDDEYATSDWLNQLVLTITLNNGDIAIGQIIPEIESRVSPTISYWFKHRPLTNNQKIDFFTSGNFIICTKFLLKYNLQFDYRFNSTGSEDSYFGVVALKKDAKIFWAADAKSYETITKKRATLKWLIRRRYGNAITYTYILILEKNYLKLLKKIAISIIYFFIGILGLVFILIPFKLRYWGVLKIATSFGGFSALLNIRFNEYHHDRKV